MKIEQKNKALFVGDMPFGRQNDIRDRIAQKKQMRQKEAMHIVTSTYRAEKKADEEGVGKLKSHISQLMDENEEYYAHVKDFKLQMQQAQEDYDVKADSGEQKDLELRKKLYDMQKHPEKGMNLTEEEKERLANLGEMTEYQNYAMDLYKQQDFWQTKIDDNQRVMAGEAKVIRQIRIDRLQYHAMADAEKAKEEILEAASKEIIGMLKDDMKEKIDEKTEEIKEAAEKREEKKEEQEERIEAAQEKKSQAEAVAENISESISDMTKQVVESDEILLDMDDEIKKLMEEEKLLIEDLKGMTVDTQA